MEIGPDPKGIDLEGGRIPLHAATWELDRSEGEYINELKSTHTSPLSEPCLLYTSPSPRD